MSREGGKRRGCVSRRAALARADVSSNLQRTGRRELSAMTNAIGDRDIEFALHAQSTATPAVAGRARGQQDQTAATARHDGRAQAPGRLLITGDPRKPGGAHPLRLTLIELHYTDMDRLVRQAYGFTKTSYRGFQQTREPSPSCSAIVCREGLSLVPYGFSPASEPAARRYALVPAMARHCTEF